MTAKSTRAELIAEYLCLKPYAHIKSLTKAELRFLIYIETLLKAPQNANN